MTVKKLAAATAALLSAALLLSGCGAGAAEPAASDPAAAEAKTEIRYGKAQGPYTVLFEEAIIPILQEEGYTFEKTDFSDLLQNDLALNEKAIDVNVEQHQAYASNFNEAQGGKLELIGPIPTVPAGLFSGRHSSLDAVADGMTVAVPNDAANTARAYALLQKAGWIKLDPAKDVATVTKNDIVENPKNLDFQELVNTTVAATLPDFDYAVITGSIVYNAKIDPATALLQEDILPHLVLGVAVHEDNADAPWARAIVDAYASDEFKAYMEENNTGLWWIPEELR
ncbi:MAG: MetQ/NlpA family ABC transporter substrate-binding protein [Propionibacteriaceae bacterium]|nr:MetQ/NlpA family ABC transporter substrate-binding protein [Propionibacteriaceae bacterium]